MPHPDYFRVFFLMKTVGVLKSAGFYFVKRDFGL